MLAKSSANGIGEGLRTHRTLDGTGLGTTYVAGNLLTLVDVADTAARIRLAASFSP